MGTRSLTRVNSGEHKYVNLYRQMDGYPSGHGKELFNFLDGMKIVNGIPAGQHDVKLANGPGCLAAQLVANFKIDVGGFYLEPVTSTDCDQDYEYIINANVETGITVTVRSYEDVLFSGMVPAFGEWLANEED